MSLVMPAYAVMAAVRHQANSITPQQNTVATAASLIRWSIQKSDASP